MFLKVAPTGARYPLRPNRDRSGVLSWRDRAIIGDMDTEESRDSRQLSFFPEEAAASHPSTQTPAPSLPSTASLSRAMGAFEKYMQDRGFTENTQQAFRQDMAILSDYLGAGKSIDSISTATLNAFLRWMRGPRGVQCSPKTLERRITTLKVFFGWLTEEGILPRDAAAPLIHGEATPELPYVLSDAEIEAVLRVTQAQRQGSDEKKPDARPHLLVTLLLATGIKKGECVSIHLNHIDLSDTAHPALWIRYKNARQRHKERRIALPAGWSATLREYMEQYPSRQYLFPWSARNLEYVLTDIAQEAQVPDLSFTTLRWTCSVRDHLEGMDAETLRQKLGLSKISWYEVETKLATLAQLVRKA